MKQFACGMCEDSFTLKVKLFQHKINVHANELNTKSKQHIQEILKNLNCDSCGKYFPKKSMLKNHIDSVHLKLKPYKCEDCDKTFSLKRILKLL